MGKITATDRLIFTLLFSVIIHLVIVLGVSFNTSSPLTNAPQMSLDITLVKQQTDEAADKADYLAQADNDGGGEIEDKTPEPSPELSQPSNELTSSSSSVSMVSPIQNTPKPEPISIPKNAASPAVSEKKSTPKKAVKQQTSPSKALVQQKAKRIVHQALELADKRQEKAVIAPDEKPKITARKLILPSQSEISQLEDQFDATAMALSNKPKKRTVSASTKEYAAAAYMKGWEMKVERIGNFNYPQEAKRKGINGSLMLTVDINPDGSVPPDGIVISRSSGHKILDDAAIRIVRLGAPYSAIPDNVLKDSDMLTIIRTWKFETNRGLSAR